MIEVRNLNKEFGGRPALRDVSFSVGKGEVLGFLGPNGAGKTTTMRILTCYLSPDSGSASVCGFDVFESSLDVKRRIGYLPESPPLYGEMTVRGYLEFVARIREVPRGRRRGSVQASLEKCGLEEVQGRIIANISKGFRQRVGLAQAVLHDPPVLILDEPTVGLDPEQIVEIRELIKGLAGDHTVILSTHILPEVTMTCSRAAIISYGEIVQEGSLADLGAVMGREKVRIRVARATAGAAGLFRGIEGVASVTMPSVPGIYLVEFDPAGETRERIAAAAVHNDLGLLEMTTVTRTLEEVYLEATRRLPAESEPEASGRDGAGVPGPDAGEGQAKRKVAGAVVAGGAGS